MTEWVILTPADILAAALASLVGFGLLILNLPTEQDKDG